MNKKPVRTQGKRSMTTGLGTPQVLPPPDFHFPGEGLDVGMDIGSPIDFTYELPFAFTGSIDHVIVEVKPEPKDASITAQSTAAGKRSREKSKAGA